MADELRLALTEVLRKAGVEQADFLREGVRVLAQELMEMELAEHVAAERHERTPERNGYRNGYRERPWDTRVGTIELQVPRVRDGSFFPSLLEPRRRAERALVAVVQEAYVQGISTRRVDDLRSAQRGLFEADTMFADFVGRPNFYGFLASQRDELFRDEDFAALYCCNNGRPSVPPSLLATAS